MIKEIEIIDIINSFDLGLIDKKQAESKLFDLFNVSQQSELLAFLEILEKLPRVNIPYDMKILAIYNYLKDNCG